MDLGRTQYLQEAMDAKDMLHQEVACLCCGGEFEERHKVSSF